MKIKNFVNLVLNPKRTINTLIEKRIDKNFKDLGYLHISEKNETDIFIVAFPKSGITWLQSIIASLQFEINPNYLSFQLVQDLVPDIYDKKYYKRYSNLVFFKSHELPKENYRNVIYLVRDGRDAMVSYSHFNKKLGSPYDLNEMIFDEKYIYPCAWYDHVQAWIENPYNADIIYIKYEDLLYNPLETLKKICQFTGIERSDEFIKRVIKGNSFENVKNRATKYQGLGHRNWQGEKAKDFFRKGKSGDYINQMNKEMITFFTKKAKKQLDYFNYQTNIDEILQKKIDINCEKNNS